MKSHSSPVVQAVQGVSTSRRGFVGIALAGLALAAGRPVLSQADDQPLRLPASTTLQYVVKARYRGLSLQSDATLIWQHDAQAYHAEWNVRVPFLGERSQSSDGSITAAGLRPHEYVEQTNKQRSARFDYDAQRVHFSGDRTDAVLKPGAQDRLTVSLQLGALLAADPDRYPVGSSLALPVVGVRGAETWHWDVKPAEALSMAGRQLSCVRLERRPRKEADSGIVVWLAPELDYLPVRLRVVQKNGDVVDQQLREMP